MRGGKSVLCKRALRVTAAMQMCVGLSGVAGAGGSPAAGAGKDPCPARLESPGCANSIQIKAENTVSIRIPAHPTHPPTPTPPPAVYVPSSTRLGLGKTVMVPPGHVWLQVRWGAGAPLVLLE